MSSRERSPRIFRSGLWSTATIMSLHPSTKNLALSRASATARASPSIGAYRDSTEWVNRLPTSEIFHPSRQQNGVAPGHVQCFWNIQKPIPSLDQSVARQVGLALSNIRTPSSTSAAMASLDSTKISSNSSFHANEFPGFRSSLNGSMRSALLKAYDTWFTRPNHERISVMLRGVGNSRMACKYLLQGRTVSMVMLKPAKSTSSWHNTNLSGYSVMPFLPQTSSQLAA